MNNLILTKISFSDKRLLVKSICDFEKRLNPLRSHCKSGEVLTKENRNAKNLEENESKYSVVKAVIDNLPYYQRMIIIKKYVKPDYNEWYLNLWSKSTYYRKFQESIDGFIYQLFLNDKCSWI